jgi:putative transposase
MSFTEEGFMSRKARAVAVGYPHHITQRGNNREPVFFDDKDRVAYLQALRQYTEDCKVDIWAYCLMPNHTHLLAVPHAPDALAQAIGRTNLKYTRYINRKHYRTGRVWQNRFYSSIVDTDRYLWGVSRYIENNPVKAGLVACASDYPWSSAQHHLGDREDDLMKAGVWLRREEQAEYRAFLDEEDQRLSRHISKATLSGRPICGERTLAILEKALGRSF